AETDVMQWFQLKTQLDAGNHAALVIRQVTLEEVAKVCANCLCAASVRQSQVGKLSTAPTALVVKNMLVIQRGAGVRGKQHLPVDVRGSRQVAHHTGHT